MSVPTRAAPLIVVLLLCLAGGLRSVAAQGAPDWVGRGYQLLEQGSLEPAEESFRRALAQDPKHAPALEGLMWTVLRRGQTEQAAALADQRLAQDPAGAWRRTWLSVIENVPGRRSEALEAYAQLVRAQPRDLEIRLSYARLLSWTEGRQSEAVREYRKAVKLAPEHRAAHLGLAQTLAWSGDISAAAELYDSLLDQHPDDVEALLGRAQAARWSGLPHKARTLLKRALQAKPDDQRLLSEYAHTALALGDRSLARDTAALVLDQAPTNPEALKVKAMIAQQTAPRTEVVSSYYQESPTNLTRYNVGAQATVFPWVDTRLRPTFMFSEFIQEGDRIHRLAGGIELEQGIGRGLYLRAGYLALLPTGAMIPVRLEHSGELAFIMRTPISLASGVRHRPLVDAPLEDSVIAALPGTGSGGMSLGVIGEGLALTEGWVSLAFPLWRGSYIYGSGSIGAVHEAQQNMRHSVAAGLGIDVIALWARQPTVHLVFKHNYFLLGYKIELPHYFSPSAFQVHSPGAELRWDISDWGIIGVEGLVSLRSSAPLGFVAGGFSRFELGRFRIEGRLGWLDDTSFRTLVGGLRLAHTF